MTRLTLFYSAAISVILIIGCKPVPLEEATFQPPSACEIDSSFNLEIPVEQPYSHDYRYTQIVTIDEKVILIGINKYANQLDFINLTDKKPEKWLTFESDGPVSMPSLKAFYYHNADSIFLFNDYKIGLADSKGKFAFVIKVNNPNSPVKGIDFSETYLHARAEDPLYFDPEAGWLYFGLHHVAHNQWSKDYYRHSICGRLDLSDLAFEVLPIYFPDSYKLNRYGLLNNYNITYSANKIIYNFNNSSKIFIFDTGTASVKSIRAESKFAVADAAIYKGEDRDVENLIEHADENPIYLKIIPELSTGNFYRFTWLPEPEKNLKKRAALTVFSPDFNLLSETLTPRNISPYWVTAPQGVPIYSNESSESVNRYYFFHVKCE